MKEIIFVDSELMYEREFHSVKFTVNGEVLKLVVGIEDGKVMEQKLYDLPDFGIWNHLNKEEMEEISSQLRDEFEL